MLAFCFQSRYNTDSKLRRTDDEQTETTAKFTRHHPRCGDEIELEIKMNGDVIEDLAFTGHGCAISQASTSIMIDTLIGKTKEEALEIIDTFIGMIKREIKEDSELEKLEDAIAFKNVSNMPARVKCAVLAWHTIKDLLDKEK